MSQTVILFHSALGLRPSVGRFADRLRANGHLVHTPDLYRGSVFDTLEEGVRHQESIGIPALVKRAMESVAGLPSEVIYAGFSMGAASAQLLAATRDGARGAILMHGALPLSVIGVDRWPAVPVQIHYAEKDPWVERESVEALVGAVREAEQECSIHTYSGSSHLFADDEFVDYNERAAREMIDRVLAFVDHIDGR